MIRSLKKFGKLLIAAAIVGSLGLVIGCGNSGINDQGVSVTLLGFFQDADGDTGSSGRVVPLSTDPESSGEIPGILVFYGLQNNLVGQGIRVDRIFLNFFVDGATQQPPATTVPAGILLGPGATDENSPTSSLPPGWTSVENIQYWQNFIVPADIMAWLNLNRNYLPEPPFLMTVHARASGVTTAGDRLETNTMDYGITFTPDQEIPPSGGTGGGTSSLGAEDGNVAEDGTVSSEGGSTSSSGL